MPLPGGFCQFEAMRLLLLFLLLALPLHAAPVEGTDVDNRKTVLNASGRVGVVLSSSPATQKATREAGRVLDAYRGRPDFQLFIVVDLRGSIAGALPPIVRGEMRENLNGEAKRLAPFYAANGNAENPRGSLEAFSDFDGKLSRSLGWAETPEKLRCVVYGKDGQEAARWDDLRDYAALQAAVKKALGL
ncbi:MAG: hypothetical protein PW734_01710 [Verrucomicrobium sp.]|nr:hypothetical protein [Verrucomicrobium sp.]